MIVILRLELRTRLSQDNTVTKAETENKTKTEIRIKNTTKNNTYTYIQPNLNLCSVCTYHSRFLHAAVWGLRVTQSRGARRYVFTYNRNITMITDIKFAPWV